MPILCEELSQSLRVSPENPFDCKFYKNVPSDPAQCPSHSSDYQGCLCSK